MREYTQLIANVNRTLNKVENGDYTVAKAVKANSAISAERVGVVSAAREASQVKKVQSAGFGSVVPDIGIPFVRSIDFTDGAHVFDRGDYLPEGVYIVVVNPKGYSTTTKTGVLVIDATRASYCRLSSSEDTNGATFKHYYSSDTRAAFIFVEKAPVGDYETAQSNDGTVYFYRIGTLKKEA